MPLYEYECEECGVFDSFRPISEASKPMACPACNAMSPRAWSIPGVRTMSPVSRMAAERNEKSRHAPHVCRSSCGCGKKKKSAAAEPGKLQRYTGPRSWVIEHA